MHDLLHEYWANDEGGDFGPVSERRDQLRPSLVPNAHKVFELRASIWNEAMRLYNERLDYGEYVPPDGVEDHVYTDDEAAKQEAYLAVRNVR